MAARLAFLLVLGLAGGCLDTHDASLGEQQRRDEVDPAPDGGAEEAGLPPFDAGAYAQRDAEDSESDDEEQARDAATSLLCRLEPWHCP